MANLLSYYSWLVDITHKRDGWADSIYLDLKKALVAHRKLLWKLESTGGLKDKIKERMKDCLDGTEMRTVI